MPMGTFGGVTMGVVYGRRKMLGYAVGCDSVERLGSSLEVVRRNIGVSCGGDNGLKVVEFCWMHDGSLIVVGKVIWGGDKRGGVVKKGRIKGEMWVFKEGLGQGGVVGVPDRCFVLGERGEGCGLCGGKFGCILCGDDGFGEVLGDGGEGFAWEDVVERIGALGFKGYMDVGYFKKEGGFGKGRGGELCVGDERWTRGGRLGFCMGFRLPYTAKAASEDETAFLKQLFVQKVLSGCGFDLKHSARSWNSNEFMGVPLVDPFTSAGLPMDVARSPRLDEPVVVGSASIVQEIKGLVDQGSRQGIFATASAPRTHLQNTQLQLPLAPSSPPPQQLLTSSAPTIQGVGMSRSVSPRSEESSAYVKRVGDRDYRCILCDKSFVKKSNAVRHRLTVHDKMRPFKCNICKQAFGHRTHLSRHQSTRHGMVIVKKPRVQTRQRRTSTSSKGLAANQSISTALEHHHSEGEVKLGCSLCELTFGQQSALNRHFRSTHQRRRIQCLVCFADFGQMYDLERHFKRKHPECGNDAREYSSVVYKGVEEPPQAVRTSSAPQASPSALFCPSPSTSFAISHQGNVFGDVPAQEHHLPINQGVMTQGSAGLSLLLNQQGPSFAAATGGMLSEHRNNNNNPNVSEASITTSTDLTQHVTHPFSCA